MTHRSLHPLQQEVKRGRILQNAERATHSAKHTHGDGKRSARLHGEGARYHFEATRDIAAEDPGLQRLHVAAHVRLRVHDVTVVCQLVEDLHLLVGENDVGVEGLHHEQRLAQSPGAFTQHLDTKRGRETQRDRWKNAGKML